MHWPRRCWVFVIWLTVLGTLLGCQSRAPFTEAAPLLP